MSTSSRRRNGIAISTLAACALIGGTSPVWAGTGGHAASTTPTAASSASSPDAATIALLRAEVAKLSNQLTTDRLALEHATKAEHAAVRAAHASQNAATRWRHEAHTRPATRTVVVTKTVPDSSSSDSETHKHCHHGTSDPAQMSNDWRWHHHCHHGDDPNGRDGQGYEGHSEDGHRSFGH